MSNADDHTLQAFIDLRSPYSYLAIQPARELAQRHGLALDWWPFITDFQGAYGGEVDERSTRDIAKVKYLYMDCRRLARPRGLTIRATTKLWDPTLGSQAMLFAKSRGRLWAFCDPLLAAFWRREFDLESAEDMTAALVQAGLDAGDWANYRHTQADSALASALDHAARAGVFGAPTFVWRGELFWGGDRLPLLETTVAAALAAQPDSKPGSPSVST